MLFRQPCGSAAVPPPCRTWQRRAPVPCLLLSRTAQAAHPTLLPPATLLRRHPDLVGNVVGGFNAVNGEDPANFVDRVRLDTRLACGGAA